ncbi:hypothetical protein ACGFS9_32215 [Streptomyces sp. NPDC048566]|uniref:hypothetical protein n=1 Tax=Streptomyces sp. NPDC048566 TaxID=3365569 RepID=UPI00370FEB3E
MPDPTSAPLPEPRREDIASRAWAEALAMACADPGHARRDAGELLAAALRAHHTLTRGPRRSVPLTALGAHGDVRALAAFVAVYAAQQDAAGECGRRGGH